MIVSLGDQILADRVTVARGLWRKGVGLMGRRFLHEGEGLLIPGCSSIHMFFMRIPLDVIFLDAERRVVKVHRQVKPWCLAFGGKGARDVLELAADAIPAAMNLTGQTLTFTHTEAESDRRES